MGKASKPAFYAVRVGKRTGVFLTWDECFEYTQGYPNSRYKKFSTRHEAERFVIQGHSSSTVTGHSDTPAASTSTGQATPTFNVFASAMEEDLAPGEIVVYCDGACKSNGKVGAIAGVGVWWGHNDKRNLAERCPGKQTNNRAELIALVRVLEQYKYMDTFPLRIMTDSKYSMKCVDDWLPKWQINGFRTSKGDPVENQTLIRYLAQLLHYHSLLKFPVKMQYVKGHAGIEGNEMADLMANRGTVEREEEDRDWETLAQATDEEVKEAMKQRRIAKSLTHLPTVIVAPSRLKTPETQKSPSKPSAQELDDLLAGAEEWSDFEPED